MAALTQETIDELKSKQGPDVELISIPDETIGTFVFRTPSKGEWRQYMDEMTSDSKRASRDAAMHRLAAQTCVWPGAEDLRIGLDKRPAYSTRVVEQLSIMAGAIDQDADVKKL